LDINWGNYFYWHICIIFITRGIYTTALVNCTCTGFVTRLTRRVSLVEQKLVILPEHLDFSGVRVARSLVFCVVFCRSLFVLLSFSFGHCVVCPHSIYGFVLPLWYLQIHLKRSEPKYGSSLSGQCKTSIAWHLVKLDPPLLYKYKLLGRYLRSVGNEQECEITYISRKDNEWFKIYFLYFLFIWHDTSFKFLTWKW
jgi:hypothetical protein